MATAPIFPSLGCELCAECGIDLRSNQLLRCSRPRGHHYYQSLLHQCRAQVHETMLWNHAGHFFKDKEAFANMPTDYRAVVSGRAALHVRTLTDKNACYQVSNRSLTYTEPPRKCSIHIELLKPIGFWMARDAVCGNSCVSKMELSENEL